MKLTEAQRRWILWGSRFVFLGGMAALTQVVPEAWETPVMMAGLAAFMASWVALGATSLFDGGTARSARTPRGYRSLDLGSGEPGPKDRAPADS